MSAREVVHARWSSVLGDFGLRHFGWEVRLEKKSHGRSKVLNDDRAYLEELGTELVDGHPQIKIVLGTPFRAFHTHVVSHALHLRVMAGEHAALEIDCVDGSTLVMHLRRRGRGS